ncbi:PP2C family protein-serine/threonine phosphatase [Streptomyces sp. FIT100]|uniref:PP2C family protein-serine/threonine phosphatase n=1 Tax=Streptomyces sp. FIT100 TaxID=2837956 RepID=UPI0021C8C79C|nr:PP2C family protein-serine/threonine phosphatase [Streptomyces sp. FIT100]UUN29968.1 SpoIIE family protein phosphatase [Streptomyces sp. FIT100]
MPDRRTRRRRRPPSLRENWIWWLPFLTIVLDLVAEVAVRGQEPVSFLLIGVPPLAAATRGPRGTALATAVCLGLQMLLAALRPGHFGEQHHVALYVATVVIGAASIALAAQRERTREHLIRANSVAEAMQKTLLRPVPRDLGPVRAAGFYSAGEGGTLVGGDLYDLCATPFGVRAIIGDVRGKGMDAVQTVAAVLGSFRVSAHEWPDLGSLADRLELSIARNSPGEDGDPELFVTALVLEFPPSGREVRIVDRGHPPPIVVGPQGVRRLATEPALPLGLGGLCSGRPARTTVHALRPGEVLLVHTDGVSEARDAAGVFYPVLDRLAERFATGRVPDPEAVVAFVRSDTERWSAGATNTDNDDQAVLALTLAKRL